jgi:anti-sigma regulatory factor (Ser/Thr protein kinase)
MSRAEIMIRNRRGDLTRVVDAVDAFAAENRLAVDIVSDVQVALDEVLSNIVDYGYTDGADHDIRVCLAILDGMLEATVEDDGVPFNPLESAAPDTHASLQERRIGGVGLHFIRNLMIEVSYERVGRYNRLVLKKRLSA